MKKFFYIMAAMFLPAILNTAALAQEPIPFVLDAFESVSPDEILMDAEILTGQTDYLDENIQSRHVSHPDHALTVEYLSYRLESLGLEVWHEDFDCPGTQECENLIVELPGNSDSGSIWIVGAHFDSTNGYDSALPAQGAVDNASGVIVVLQAIAALRDYYFEDTIRFILFDAEEVGLVGSEFHAQSASDRGEQIELMVNLDVAGWRVPGVNYIFSNSDWPSWPDLQLLNDIALLYPTGTNHLGVPVEAIDSADMASFWDEGYNAFMIGSLYALTGWMNTELDTFDKLDLEQCANVSRLVIAYMAHRAVILDEIPPIDDDDDDNDDNDDNNDHDDPEPEKNSDQSSDIDSEAETCCG